MKMKGIWDVEVVTVLVALGIVLIWVITNYTATTFNLHFDNSFLAQLGNMAMLALGVLGISSKASVLRRAKEEEDREDKPNKKAKTKQK